MTNTKKQGGKTYHRKTIKNSGKKGGKMFQSFKKGMNEFFHGLDDDKQKNLIYNLFLLSMKPMDGQVVASMDFNALNGSAGKIFTTFGIDENIGKVDGKVDGKAGVNKSTTSNDSSLSEKDETTDFFKECSEYQTDKWRHGPTSDKSKKDLEEKRAAMKKKENPVEKQEEEAVEKPDEPKQEEQKAEEPKAEEPKADEPKAEEPKADVDADESKQEEPK
mgnify:CR=1 FL=1